MEKQDVRLKEKEILVWETKRILLTTGVLLDVQVFSVIKGFTGYYPLISY